MFFHSKQSTFRKACDLGLRVYIVEGSPQLHNDYREFVGMINAMAFVPRNHLNIAAQILQANIPMQQLQPLFNYFLVTYVYGNPLFPPTMWNQYQNSLDDKYHTNNICEGWNSAYNKAVGMVRPLSIKAWNPSRGTTAQLQLIFCNLKAQR